jgi:hypothetical protein
MRKKISKHIFLRLAKIVKAVIIAAVIGYIMLNLLGISPISGIGRQGLDLKAAAVISLGFAASLRTMLCSRSARPAKKRSIEFY